MMKPYAVLADAPDAEAPAGPQPVELWHAPDASWEVFAGVAAGVAAATALIPMGAALAAVATLVVAALGAYALLPVRAAAYTALGVLAAGAALLAFAPVVAPWTVGALTTYVVFAVACFAAALLGRATRTVLDSLVAQRDAALVDRRLAKDRSREATARLLDLAASVDELLWETDAALRLRYVSGTLERSTGIPPDQVLGQNPLDLAEKLAGRPGRFAACVARMRERRPIRGLRLLWQDRAGARHVWCVHGTPLFDDDGHFVRYRGVVVEQRNVDRGRRLRAVAKAEP
jgi:PAS domain-containing protein